MILLNRFISLVMTMNALSALRKNFSRIEDHSGLSN